ncbi:hypothetical protein THAOC_01204 [Thalassiosira oceanica]|uniref:Uncharacterized protein n=1 Tax=Thalassiosira oceanica TaxID=159749 RepID=K0TIT2_THAOC|nr:hypothetical protein THAOC_01204 [Thalassiosira oceanica]|eukprot:EJK76994.1 hypothetical protein THAOC_01204 [Thalassiosira oceanica]
MPTAIESSVPFEAEEAVLEDGDAELPEPFADEANEVAIPLEFMSNAASLLALVGAALLQEEESLTEIPPPDVRRPTVF